MNKFKKKSLYLALVAGLSAAGSASAVSLSQDGTGQVLIYPYYSVRTAGAGNNATYLNVTNTTNTYKAVKVRFLEGKNSREVLDFNLYLSPNDMWTGALSQTATGTQLTSGDNSCVTKSGGFAASVAAGLVYSEFVNYSYVGDVATGDTIIGWTAGADGEDTSLDRTREGYFEIIEMGTIYDTTVQAGLKHTSSGVPKDCSVVDTIDTANNVSNYISAPTGGLIGGASLINVNDGSDEGYDPVALENFYNQGNIWYPAGSILPDMNNAYPQSTIFTGTGYVTSDWTANWNTNADAVSAVLMRDSVMNNYVLDTATLSATDWVVTFPTKRHYVGSDQKADTPYAGTHVAYAPFHNSFWTGGACDPITVTSYDREEQFTQSSIQSSPPKPGQTDNLCWEANVITFKNSGASIADADTMLGSKNRLEVNTPYEHGWANLAFKSPLSLVDQNNTSYVGLPVVGFMVQDFLNKNVTIGGLPSASSYGGNFNHKYRRTVYGCGNC